MGAKPKVNYEKPIVKRVADLGIMLECLHEVYGSEEGLLRSGKSLRSTMAYPFVKMIEGQCQGLSVKEIHRILWSIYIGEEGERSFINKAREQLAAYERGAEI